MKTVQKYFVFGLLMTAGLIFAGCGDTSGGGTSTDSTDSSSSTEETTEGSADNASTTEASDIQLVSLTVPNMT